MFAKKRKLPGPNELEQQFYDTVLKLKERVVSKGSEEEDGFEQQIDMVLSMLELRLEGPQSFTFSRMTAEHLTKLKITLTGLLALKPNSEQCSTTAASLGQNELWSSTNLYRQLNLLNTLIPGKNEASARAWIDAFFFRASAMLPANQRMVLNMEQVVPATTIGLSSLSTLSGFVDYSAVVASQFTAAAFLESPDLEILKLHMPSGFFVTEAKPFNILSHIPQAVCGMYACGKFLQKEFLRGALTDGRSWVFLFVKFNHDYDGASYKRSSIVKFDITTGPSPDLIAAILAHWIENSFVDLDVDPEGDDWFQAM